MEFLTAKDISDQHAIPLQGIEKMILKNQFPKPDKKIGNARYWHKKTVEDFLKTYHRVRTAHQKRYFDYKERRASIIREARLAVQRYKIKTATEYYNLARDKTYSMPDSATLFRHSITFEELTNRKWLDDNDCYNIYRILAEEGKKTADELAYYIKKDIRTVYRKVNKLRENGYDVKGDRKGFWVEG